MTPTYLAGRDQRLNRVAASTGQSSMTCREVSMPAPRRVTSAKEPIREIAMSAASIRIQSLTPQATLLRSLAIFLAFS